MIGRRGLLLGALFTVAACGSGQPDADDPKPLTTEQAERLAVVRFTLYRRGVVPMTAQIPTPAGAVTLDGRMDLRSHVGMAVLTGPSTSLIQWSLSSVCSLAWPGKSAPEATPDGDWRARALDRQGSNVDSALLLALNLGSDRPENAQLLARSSARLLRADRVAGTDVDVLAGPKQADDNNADTPSRTRYWVDRDGGLRRFEARLGQGEDWMRLDPGPGAAAAITPVAALDVP